MPLFALAWAMDSATERAGEELGTTIALGYCTTRVTGRKSATGS